MVTPLWCLSVPFNIPQYANTSLLYHTHTHTPERIGKSFMRQVHSSLSGLMLRARDFVSDHETSLRDRERALVVREETLGRREEQLAQRQADLNEALRGELLIILRLSPRKGTENSNISKTTGPISKFVIFPESHRKPTVNHITLSYKAWRYYLIIRRNSSLYYWGNWNISGR